MTSVLERAVPEDRPTSRVTTPKRRGCPARPASDPLIGPKADHCAEFTPSVTPTRSTSAARGPGWNPLDPGTPRSRSRPTTRRCCVRPRSGRIGDDDEILGCPRAVWSLPPKRWRASSMSCRRFHRRCRPESTAATLRRYPRASTEPITPPEGSTIRTPAHHRSAMSLQPEGCGSDRKRRVRTSLRTSHPYTTGGADPVPLRRSAAPRSPSSDRCPSAFLPASRAPRLSPFAHGRMVH